MRVLLVAVALIIATCACTPIAFAAFPDASPKPNPPANFTGYVVTGQWDGRTFPVVEWALDITRQDTEWRPQQELKLAKLIPTTAGPALSPSFTAYDPISRNYFMTTDRNRTAASIWGINIAKDVSSATSLGDEVTYAFPEVDAEMIGFQAINTQGSILLLVFYKNGTAYTVDYKTGKTAWWADVVNSTRVLTAAIEYNSMAGEIYIITQARQGLPARAVLTVYIAAPQQSKEVPLADLKLHDPLLEMPFESIWMPTLQSLMVFYAGNFDQLLYVAPKTGATAFAAYNIAEFGTSGHFEFTANDFLEDDDLWTDAALDTVKNKIYFQATAVEPDTGDETTTMCEIPVPKKFGEHLTFINTAISPMTYGYVGFQFVEVVA